jgi:hypothetical protein
LRKGEERGGREENGEGMYGGGMKEDGEGMIKRGRWKRDRGGRK